MASYQEMESRITSLERKLDFVMSNGRMKAALEGDVLDANGQPTVKVFEGSLKELYYLINSLPIEKENGNLFDPDPR